MDYSNISHYSLYEEWDDGTIEELGEGFYQNKGEAVVAFLKAILENTGETRVCLDFNEVCIAPSSGHIPKTIMTFNPNAKHPLSVCPEFKNTVETLLAIR